MGGFQKEDPDVDMWQCACSLMCVAHHVCVIFSFFQIRRDVQTILHSYGIHNTTLQPEFIDVRALFLN